MRLITQIILAIIYGHSFSCQQIVSDKSSPQLVIKSHQRKITKSESHDHNFSSEVSGRQRLLSSHAVGGRNHSLLPDVMHGQAESTAAVVSQDNTEKRSSGNQVSQINSFQDNPVDVTIQSYLPTDSSSFGSRTQKHSRDTTLNDAIISEQNIESLNPSNVRRDPGEMTQRKSATINDTIPVDSHDLNSKERGTTHKDRLDLQKQVIGLVKNGSKTNLREINIEGDKLHDSIVDVKTADPQERYRREVTQDKTNSSAKSNPYMQTIKIATVLPADESRLFAIKRVQPAIEYAIEKMNPLLAPLNRTLVVKFRDSKCDIADGINEAINFYVHNEMDVLFGPCCDYAVAPCARQVRITSLCL